VRVLQLVPSLAVGGAERVAGLLAVHQARLGADVSVASLADPSGSFIEAELRAAGVPLHFLGKPPGLDVRVVPRLARLLRQRRPDVVHTHLHVLKYLLPARTLWPRCRVVHTVHNMAEHEIERSGRLLQQVAFRAGVAPVAIGDKVADSLRRVYHLDPAATVFNGVDVDAFAAAAGARSDVRAELGIPADAPLFVSAGRLDEQKNQSLLLDAFATPAITTTGARLLVAGEGRLRPDLEAQRHRLGLDDRVLLPGVRRDLPRLLAAADAFVLSSSWEGNPLVVMEAMAAGTAVVSTDVGCVPELVTPATGRLVPAGDAAALSATLTVLAQDLASCRALGAAGAARARQRFDAAVMARRYLDLYGALGQSAPRHLWSAS